MGSGARSLISGILLVLRRRVEAWHNHSVDLSGVNLAYIALLPKRDDPHEMNDYRPISLQHSIPKLIAKVMANRLQPKINILVDSMQSGFIKERSIVENFAAAIEMASFAKHILDAFSEFTGLQINFHKSTFVPMHMTEQEANNAASILGCATAAMPCTYLGLPLSASKISKGLLQPVINKIQKRLPGWMPRLMSSGGRIQMINSVLSAIPNFFMACIEWDQASIDDVDKLRRAFLWKNKEKILGGHCLVAWDIVTMPRKQGGLGIRDLRIHNRAVMANFTSKLLSSGVGPCFSWMASWHMQDSIPISPAHHDSYFWKSILASQFAGDHWEIALIHPLSFTAQARLQTVMNELNNSQPALHTFGGTRSMIITGKPSTTKDFYRLFSDRGLLWDRYKWVWKSLIPLRHKFFLWLAFRGRLNTKDNMVNKCWCVDAGCDQCPALESIHHIALHCKQATWVWEKLELASVAASANTLSQFVSITDETTICKAWPVCVAACLHGLWKARNDRVFNCKFIDRHVLPSLIADELRLWSNRSTKLKPQLISWADRLSS
ncbi:hypothetical protein ACQ4PT_028461 [Festuca glaucescens]